MRLYIFLNGKKHLQQNSTLTSTVGKMEDFRHPETQEIVGHHVLRPRITELSAIEKLAKIQRANPFCGNRIVSSARLLES